MTELRVLGRWVRTQGGRKIHMAGCHYAKGGAPWHWADDKTAEQIRRDMLEHGLYPTFAKCCIDGWGNPK